MSHLYQLCKCIYVLSRFSDSMDSDIYAFLFLNRSTHHLKWTGPVCSSRGERGSQVLYCQHPSPWQDCKSHCIYIDLHLCCFPEKCTKTFLTHSNNWYFTVLLLFITWNLKGKLVSQFHFRHLRHQMSSLVLTVFSLWLTQTRLDPKVTLSPVGFQTHPFCETTSDSNLKWLAAQAPMHLQDETYEIWNMGTEQSLPLML